MKICNYKGHNIGKTEIQHVTELELEEELKKLVEQQVSFETKNDKANLGDVCNINYEGFLDGVPFEGGKADGYDLELGSNTFIPGFEEGLVGGSMGEDIDVNVTFPTEYHSQELAGKPVVFKCHINEVKTKVHQELNDEFANKLGMPSLDYLKKELERQMNAKRQNENDNEYLGKLINKLLEESEVEVEDEMVKTRIDELVGYYEQNIAQYGMDLNSYLGMMNMTLEQFRDSIAENALSSVKGDILLDEIAKLETLSVLENEITDELELYKNYYGWNDEALNKFKAERYQDLYTDLLRRKVAKLLIENNN